MSANTLSVSRWLLVGAAIIACASVARAADTTPPTITVQNKSAECRAGGTSVFLNPTVVDDQDPLPKTTFAIGATAITDPYDGYTPGNTTVTVRACDSANNCATANAIVSILDTVGPAVNAGLDRTLACDQTYHGAQFVLPTPQVHDACDPSPTYTTDAPADNIYPFGVTTVTVTAHDVWGNRGSDTITLLVEDHEKPVFTVPGVDVVVAAQGDCDDPGNPGPDSNGTWVRLPSPVVSDACYPRESLLLTSGRGDGSNALCLPPTPLASPHVVQWTVYDPQNNSETDLINVWVLAAADLNLTVTATATSSAFTHSAVTVDAHVTAGTITYPLYWTLATDHQPVTRQAVNGSPDFSYTLTAPADHSQDGVYCRLNVLAEDANNRRGAPASNLPCFAIDTVAPSFVFEGIPAGAVYYYGERIPIEIVASDGGTTPAGINRVQAVVDPGPSQQIVLDRTFAPTSVAAGDKYQAPRPPTCAVEQRVTGCDSSAAPTLCEDLDPSDGDPIGSRLHLGGLGAGNHSLRIVVTDLAGNSVQTDYAFFVADMVGSLAEQVVALQALIDDPETPFDSLSFLQEAQTLLVLATQEFGTDTTTTLLAESPGLAFLLGRRAWALLDEASSLGATTAPVRRQLALAIAGESRRYFEATAAKSPVDWKILREASYGSPHVLNYDELYAARAFLHPSGRDFTVDADATLAVAAAKIAQADDAIARGQTLTGIDAAIAAYDSLVMLFEDGTLATVFGREVYEVQAGVDEGFYRRTPPARFGDWVARTVVNEINRVVWHPGLPMQTRQALSETAALLDAFALGVAPVKEGTWPADFDNERLTREVYLNAQLALEKLRTIQQSSIYTTYWQAGIVLTLGYVVNFSMYEGPTALTCNINGGCIPQVAGSFFYSNAGVSPGATLDPIAQAGECRYARLMYDLVQGRVASAAQTFVDSKCLIIALYNRYYGDASPKLIATDDHIDPTEYGCPATLPDPTLADECPCAQGVGVGSDDNCNGRDDDCDGSVDEHYVRTACGVGVCGSESVCANGVESPCTPLPPLASVDATCDGVNEDCDVNNAGVELIDEEVEVVVCGIGDCQDESSCDSGTYHVCTPDYTKMGSQEANCDGVDENCNVRVDEGLDNDNDGYGCAPASAGCLRTGAADRRCEHDDGLGWDCDDFDATVFPGAPEICDGKDNDCDGSTDEGVLTACDDCNPNCQQTTFGPGGTVPFGPDPFNSESVLLCQAPLPPRCIEQPAGTQQPGAVTLSGTQSTNTVYAWIANDTSGTVSKVSTATGKEIGRYCTALKTATDQGGQARGVANICAACGGCNRGSRTAVDILGNVFVANRSHESGGTQSTVTKIMNDVDECVDYNNDGVVRTSEDKNENGVIDMDTDHDGTVDANEANPPATTEYWGEKDECIAWTRKPTSWVTPTGVTCSTYTTQANCTASSRPCSWTNNACIDLGEGTFNARAVAIDAEGDVWLGNFRNQGFFELDPTTGKVKRWVRMGVEPYGAVIDSHGILWAPDSCCASGTIRGLNTSAAPVTLGVTSWQTLPAGAVITDTSAAATWLSTYITMPGETFNYGIAVDGSDRVWLGSYNTSWAGARYNPADDSWEKISVTQVNVPTSLDLTTAITLSAWVYHDQESGHILNRGGGWSDPGYSLFWFDNNIRVELQNSTAKTMVDTNAPANGAWHHVAFTWSQADPTIRTYIDGAAGSTGTFAGPMGIAPMPFAIGRNYLRGYYFNGRIDEARVESVVRPAAWMKAQYDSMRDAFITYGSVESTGSSWWNSSFSRRIKLTFNNSGNAPFDNFPVRVRLDGRIDFTQVQSSGEDIRFIDADGTTQLKYEIEQWLPSSSRGDVWVKVPRIDQSNTDSIYMYYGNHNAADAQARAEVWTNGYAGVWHLAGNAQDSTSNASHGAITGATSISGGAIGRAYDFDGSNDRIEVGTVSRDADRGMARGITVDTRNIAWIAQHGDGGGRVTGYDVNTTQIATVNGRAMDFHISPSATTPIGVGIGTGGKVWSANQGSQNVTVIDPETGNVAHFPVGGPAYTYSDFTGNLLRTFTAPQGTYSESIEGCFGQPVAAWRILRWTAFTPGSTKVVLRVRVAATRAGLASAAWIPADDGDPATTTDYFQTSPTNLEDAGVPDTQWIQVQALLVSDSAGNVPILSSFSVSRDCP